MHSILDPLCFVSVRTIAIKFMESLILTQTKKEGVRVQISLVSLSLIVDVSLMFRPSRAIQTYPWIL